MLERFMKKKARVLLCFEIQLEVLNFSKEYDLLVHRNEYVLTNAVLQVGDTRCVVEGLFRGGKQLSVHPIKVLEGD